MLEAVAGSLPPMLVKVLGSVLHILTSRLMNTACEIRRDHLREGHADDSLRRTVCLGRGIFLRFTEPDDLAGREFEDSIPRHPNAKWSGEDPPEHSLVPVEDLAADKRGMDTGVIGLPDRSSGWPLKRQRLPFVTLSVDPETHLEPKPDAQRDLEQVLKELEERVIRHFRIFE